MEIDIKHTENNIVIIIPKMRLTYDVSIEFENSIRNVIAQDKYNLLIDLKNVDYVSSRGISIILRYYEELKNKDGRLRLCNVTKKVLNIFRIIRLDKFFKEESVTRTADQAIQTFFD